MIRRGRNLTAAYLIPTTDQFQQGDIVKNVVDATNAHFGIVSSVSSKENKVYVAWNTGVVSQHDADELLLAAFVDDTTRERMEQLVAASAKTVIASDTLVSRRAMVPEFAETKDDYQEFFKTKLEQYGVKSLSELNEDLKKKFFNEIEEEWTKDDESKEASEAVLEDFSGNPKTHGIETPRGGGFSIMQQLTEDLHEESIDNQGLQEDKEKTSALRSRRAVYHKERGRVYRKTRRETDSIVCGRRGCDGLMELQPFMKSVKIYVCPKCGWKIDTSHVI